MTAIRAGDTWLIDLDREQRHVEVAAASDSPGWWQCIDLQTVIEFLAREPWFVDRVKAEDGC